MVSEDKDITVHSNKRGRNYHHPKGKHSHQKDNPRRSNRDLYTYTFHTCGEKGHFDRDCPRNKSDSHKKKEKRRHHAHTTEDDEPPRKRVKEESEDSSSDEEYVFIYSLMGIVTHGRNDWIIDSGASKNMKRFKESFVKFSKHEFPHKVKLGDDY